VGFDAKRGFVRSDRMTYNQSSGLQISHNNINR